MIWLLLIVGGYLVLRGTATAQINASASASPINNATGGSLSGTLGSEASPTRFFATGRTSGTGPTPVSSGPVIAGPSASASPNPIRSGAGTTVGRGGVPIFKPGVSNTRLIPVGGRRAVPTPTHINKDIRPNIANRPPATTRHSPEVASPHWTKIKPKRVAAKEFRAPQWFSK